MATAGRRRLEGVAVHEPWPPPPRHVTIVQLDQPAGQPLARATTTTWQSRRVPDPLPCPDLLAGQGRWRRQSGGRGVGGPAGAVPGGHGARKRRSWAPVCLQGLIGPGRVP
jgi:hypothetical protein